MLDENRNRLPDHVGWRLWRASKAWQADFVSRMRSAGHDWFTESRANLLGNLPRDGIGQADLIERMAMSKQAVQQLLDGLEVAGIVVRLPDPADRRGKLIRYTEKGRAALMDGDRIKLDIERAWIERIGVERFSALMDALRALEVGSRDGTD